jgi:hypothetical protein
MKTYKTEFPDFVLDVEIPAGFIDNSWHNDAMPNWIRELPDGRMVVLWVDYLDPAKREILPESGRFILHLMNNTLTDVQESYITADYYEITAQLIDYFFPWIDCSDDQLLENRAELWEKIPSNDHARNSKGLDMLAEIDAEIKARKK